MCQVQGKSVTRFIEILLNVAEMDPFLNMRQHLFALMP